MTSDAVDDANLAEIAREVLLGISSPRFSFVGDGLLGLSFERQISLTIERNEYRYPDENIEDEVSVDFPDVKLNFNFRNGFYDSGT